MLDFLKDLWAFMKERKKFLPEGKLQAFKFFPSFQEEIFSSSEIGSGLKIFDQISLKGWILLKKELRKNKNKKEGSKI